MNYFYDEFTTPQNSSNPSDILNTSDGVSLACTRSIYEQYESSSTTISNNTLTFQVNVTNPEDVYPFLTYAFAATNFLPLTIYTTISENTPPNSYDIQYTLSDESMNTINGNVSNGILSFDVPNLENVKGFVFQAQQPNGVTNFSLGPLTNSTCISGDSLVLTKQSYKPISQLQRGDEIEGGRIAAIIKDKLPSYITLVKIGNVKTCSNHVLIHNGKRILAKDYPDAEIIYGKTEDLLPDPYLYDIQFDFEGSYFLEGGLESQSRSPYCHLTPLDKDKYFNLDNYKPVRVDNTLRLDPAFN